MKRLKGLLLNLSGMGCCSTSQLAAQSYLQDVSQQKCSDILIGCLEEELTVVFQHC